MLSKKNREHWISLSPEIKKLRQFWLETSNSDLPMLISGEEGVGKSYWILESMRERKLEPVDTLKIDYFIKKDFFKDACDKITNNKIRCFWWENLSKANDEELRQWTHWWKEQRYKKSSDVYLYWEISNSELKNIQKNPIAFDLYEQLKQFQFKLNPLITRKADLPLFIQTFLMEANQTLKKNILSFDEQFMDFFSKRKFNNNIQGLKDFVFSAVAFTSKKRILFSTLPIQFLENSEETLAITVGVSLEDYEKAIIVNNLKYVDGNRVKASKLLGISERNLYRKIKQYQLEEES